MDRKVQESIEKFEQKREFREVKLKTRQSFREDQEALDQRLSKYRSSGRRTMSAEDAADDTCNAADVSVHSKLEDIVLDIKNEKSKENVNEDCIDAYVEAITKPVDGAVETLDREKNGHGETVKLNGHVTPGNGTPVYEIKHVPNGSVSGTGSLSSRGHLGSMTPGPRLKLSGKRGIYEKNPKLTSSSTDHLDNVSVRSFKASPAQGLRMFDIQQQPTVVPIVPSIPVASIPTDGNLRDFNVDEMVTIFRMMNIGEDLLLRFSANKVDGKRFAAFSDKDLDTLGICNPIVRYFRDRSAHRRKKGPVFML